MTDPVTAETIAEAHARIAPYLPPTPLEPAPKLGAVWLKLENVNPTHSFKIRGAGLADRADRPRSARDTAQFPRQFAPADPLPAAG